MNQIEHIQPEPYSLRKDLESVIRIPPPATLSLVVLTMLGFAVQVLFGVEEVLLWFGIVPAHMLNISIWFTVAEGQQVPVIVTILTYLFFHGGWWHIGSNLPGLWLFGIYAEEEIGWKKLLSVYIITGLITPFAIASQIPNDMEAIGGASGAIGGIMGAYLFSYLSRWVQYRNRWKWIILIELAAVIGMAVWMLFRNAPAHADVLSSVIWHLIPFLAGWGIMRIWNAFS